MNLKITINNYEEIMFRLVEDDFDKQTRTDLLQQIEADELFKFEWESWQKTKFVDPLGNYSIESTELAEKIIMIAEPQTSGRNRFFYYWAAAASIIFLFGTLFLLTSDFTHSPKPEVVQTIKKTSAKLKTPIILVQSQYEPIVIANKKQIRNQKRESKNLSVVKVSDTQVPVENTLAKIPLSIDSVPVKPADLAQAPTKKPRYTITIETSDIESNNLNNNDLALSKRGSIKKIFTNTKLLLSRKPNGEPDRIILVGDENSYLCININY